MNNLSILAAELVVLVCVSSLQPMRGWLRNLMSQRYLLAFLLPFVVLVGWPITDSVMFREGQELGWQRVARIVLFTSFFGLTLLVALQRRSLRVPRSGPLGLFAVYAVFAGASALYSVEPLQSAWKAFELFVLLILAVHLLGRRINPISNAVGLANGLFYWAFAVCLMSLVGGFLAPERAWGEIGGLATRPSMAGVLPMVHPNMLGQLGGMVGLVGVSRLLVSSQSHSLGDWLLPAVGVATLLLAYSRTSLIAFSVLFLVLIVILRRVSLVLLMVPVLVLGLGLFSNPILHYLARGQDPELFASLSGRTHMWEPAFQAWSQSPWFGHGYFVGHKYVELAGSGRLLATVDNMYVETLVDLGTVGLGLIVGFALLMFRLAWRVLFRCRVYSPALMPTAISLFVFVGFILIRSLTASSFQVLHYNLVFLMVSIVALHLLESGLSRNGSTPLSIGGTQPGGP